MISRYVDGGERGAGEGRVLDDGLHLFGFRLDDRVDVDGLARVVSTELGEGLHGVWEDALEVFETEQRLGLLCSVVCNRSLFLNPLHLIVRILSHFHLLGQLLLKRADLCFPSNCQTSIKRRGAGEQRREGGGGQTVLEKFLLFDLLLDVERTLLLHGQLVLSISL